MMRAAGGDADGTRLRGLIVLLWRPGLRISEALALAESDLDAGRGAILVRHGKGGKRREVGMDRWGWEQLSPWLRLRSMLPGGALFCILRGPNPRTAVGPGRRPDPTARDSRSRWGTTTVCSASTASRARCGDVARGRSTVGHPAPARTRRPRDHLGLLARNRQHRDCPRRSRAAGANDPCPQRAASPPLGWAVPRATHPRPAVARGARERSAGADHPLVAKGLIRSRSSPEAKDVMFRET